MNPFIILFLPVGLVLSSVHAASGSVAARWTLPGVGSTLADFSNLPIVAIIAVGGSFLLTAIIIIYGLKFAQRRQELWHETARLALEKGQPLPKMPEDDAHREAAKEDNDFRTGLILVATGAGMYFFFGTFLVFLRYVGAIPGLIGVALLVYATLKALFGRKAGSSGDDSSRP